VPPRRLTAPPSPSNVARLHKPAAPSHLEPEERRFWDAILADYAVDSDAALMHLRVACDALAQARKCQEQINTDGVLIVDRRGNSRAHPLLKEATTARNNYLAAMRALHLDIGPAP
jgi:phage terminase small subunit